MKMFLVRYLFPVLFLFVAFAGASYLITELIRGIQPTFDIQTLQMKGAPEVAEKGRHLFSTRGCADCHGEDAGGKVFIADSTMGTIAGSNLTKGRGGVGENYKTVKDWHRAIRYGLNAAGHPLVFMPSYEYASLSQNDTAALILYLYNLPRVDREVPKSSPALVPRMMYLLGQMPILFAYSSIDNERGQIQDVPETLSPEYGKYLTETCKGCHGSELKGGRIKGVPPSWPKAADLTKAGVMSKYSGDAFRTLLRAGKTMDGRNINPAFMPWPGLSKMTDIEIDSIYLYLRTL
jgi:mono/diheme cytochrome c family protein